MKDKINVAELLKDCPKGMELDCTMYDGVYFDHVNDLGVNKIKCYVNNSKEHFEIALNKYGQYVSYNSAKCVIFPKGKTTWEGFVPPYKYPKTYEECCDVLGVNPSFDIKMIEEEESALYFHFIDLVRCRNAYWKIAGEQIGLGKPWEPDWAYNCIKYIITVAENEIYTDVSYIFNYILVFPTEEMRDAFYENFKDLIEQCKELL